MLLKFSDGLIKTTHFDPEMARLADRHYSRRTVGARQFAYSGRKIVLRDADGLVLFVWLYPKPELRMDDRAGYHCTIFRNESGRLSSDIILEAERAAVEKWGTAAPNGFCLGCGEFWGGITSFDLRGICDNCDFTDDVDGDDDPYYDDEYDYSEPGELVP